MVDQGMNISRAGWEHRMTPLPRRPVRFVTRDTPVIVSVPRVVGARPRTRRPSSDRSRNGVGSGARGQGSPPDRSRGRKRRRSSGSRDDGRLRSSTPFVHHRGRGSPVFDIDSDEAEDYGKATAKSKKKSRRSRKVTVDPPRLVYTQDAWEELTVDAHEEDDLASIFAEYLTDVSPGRLSPEKEKEKEKEK